jgi:hypothetical protein
MRLAWFMTVTAVVEAGTGLLLLMLPAGVFASLLGVREAGEEALLLGRVLGSALLAIGVACWLARRDQGGPAQHGVLVGVLIYDAAAAALLASASLILNMTGLLLWPAVVLHTALAVWCVCCLWGQRRPTNTMNEREGRVRY